MSVPQQIDLTASKETRLDITTDKIVLPTPLAALPRAGFILAKIILAIIAGYLLFLVIYIGVSKSNSLDKIDLSSKAALTDSTGFVHQQALLQVYQTEMKNSREFIMQISQMILLNLLLPILTAILGYIFGSREESRKTIV